jgi:hypothetical protein
VQVRRQGDHIQLRAKKKPQVMMKCPPKTEREDQKAYARQRSTNSPRNEGVIKVSYRARRKISRTAIHRRTNGIIEATECIIADADTQVVYREPVIADARRILNRYVAVEISTGFPIDPLTRFKAIFSSCRRCQTRLWSQKRCEKLTGY